MHPMHLLMLSLLGKIMSIKILKERTGKVSGTQEPPNKSWLNEGRRRELIGQGARAVAASCLQSKSHMLRDCRNTGDSGRRS